MIVREMTRKDADIAVAWLTERMRRRSGRDDLEFSAAWMPETGLAACDGTGRVRCVAVLYLEKSSPVAVFGWVIADPANSHRESSGAVRRLLAAMPSYAESKGAKHLISMFGSRSVNRILNDSGFVSGDSKVEQKYRKL